MKRSLSLSVSLFMIFAAACSPGGPLRQVTRGDELAHYNFSEPRTFEEGAYREATLRIVNGAYRIEIFEGNNTLWWGQWGESYRDVVIDVDVRQLSERNENAYGVMCRVRGNVGQPQPVDPELAAIMEDEPLAAESTDAPAEAPDESSADAEATDILEDETTPVAETTTVPEEVTDEPEVTVPTAEINTLEGDGYLFLIQGSGSYAIMRARGRDVQPLVNWTTSDKIVQGPGENHLRAICAGNYLAFYINGEFVADTTDDAYTQGQIGLAGSAYNRLGLTVEFDNLSVAEARLS